MKRTIIISQHILGKTVLFAVIALFSINISLAQASKKDKSAAIKSMVENKNFVFKAQGMTPQRGGFRNLTSDYDMTVTGDSLITYLPFFGRAFVAPINPNDGGIQFTSTNFSYTVEPRKKGGWQIVIKPSDTKDVREMLLTVSESGTAYLNVSSNNRDAISFNGYIAERKSR